MYYVFADSAQSYSAQIYKSWKNIRTKLAQQAANGPLSLSLSLSYVVSIQKNKRKLNLLKRSLSLSPSLIYANIIDQGKREIHIQ